MKLSYRLLVFMMALVWCITAASSLASAAPMPKEKDKEKEHEGQNVDSGSFGVFQNGHRVGTETFSIYQTNGGSVIQSEFKTVNAPTDAVQTSEMQLTPTGEIRRYEWKELSPGKATSVVLPNSDFLTQKWKTGPEEKEQEHALPAAGVDQHPRRLLLRSPRTAGLEVSCRSLQTGKRASDPVPPEAAHPVSEP